MQQILLNSSCSSCPTVCQSYQPEKLRNPVQKRCFHISQHFTEVYSNTPLHPFLVHICAVISLICERATQP